MSAEPTFTRAGQTSLYWLDPAPSTVGFWSSEATVLGANPTLTQSWADSGGTYLFLGASPANQDAFITALSAYLQKFRPNGAPRFLWLQNPVDPMLSWLIQELFVVPVPADALRWQIAQRVDFAFDDYTVMIRRGAIVAPGDAGDAGWGFGLADPSDDLPASMLLTPADQLPARGSSTTLSMSGSVAGCWRFVFDAAAPSGGTDIFSLLDCLIQYFMPDPEDDSILPIGFSVLRQPTGTPLTFYATVDSLRPLNGDRTNFSFFSWSGSGSPIALHSGFATARGYGIDLTPLASGSGTLAPARLVFAFAPSGVNGPGDPRSLEPGSFYLVPDGAYAVTVLEPANNQGTTGEINRLLCGTSGLEYLGLPTAGGSALTFVPGKPAYAPLDSKSLGQNALSPIGTTSWVYAQAPSQETIRYYAQPEDAPLFHAPTPRLHLEGIATTVNAPLLTDSIGFLDFLEIVAADLPAANGNRAFPMAPYRDLDASLLTNAMQLEQLALAPCRRANLVHLLGSNLQNEPSEAMADGDAVTIGVTPQGMAVGVAADDETWTWLGIGQTGLGPAPKPDLRFTKVEGDFKQAMLTNNLFMVLGNAEEFARDGSGSVSYRLTALILNVIGASPVAKTWPADLLPAVKTFFSAHGYISYPTRTAFEAALRAAYALMTDEEMLVFRRFAGELTPVIEGWPFRLSPDNWTDPNREGQTNTYLIFKFVLGRSVSDLVGDLSTWAWPAVAAPGGAAAAQQDILEIINASLPPDGLTLRPSGSPYSHFVQVVTDPFWTGILALSVEVPLDALPGPLQALAAGIDPQAFRAHHVGMSVTPFKVNDGALTFSRSSMFGLIDYENPEDQYFSTDISFAFRVLQLTVGFENSTITTFTSRVELLVNRLFGSATRLFPADHGNNVILEGAYQKQRTPDGAAHDAYVFASPGTNVFQLEQSALQSVELLATQLLTSKAADPASGDATVVAILQMTGNLRFYEPPDFDPFCWGPGGDADGHLRFGNLAVNMSFALGNPAETTLFTLLDGNLSFDMANSLARPNALSSRFPIRLTRLIAMPDPKLSPPPSALLDPTPPSRPQTPEDMGFVSISAPIDQSLMTQPWYGLNYTIDLGTLGALAGSVGITLEVLAGWSAGKDSITSVVYLGVKLPGSNDTFGTSLPLQGIIKLGFRSIEFMVDNTEGQPRTYTLRLRDFALRLLSLSFPPGHNDIYLFGNPNQSSTTKVGWYAAYAADQDPKKKKKTPGRRFVQASRPAVRLLPEENVGGRDAARGSSTLGEREASDD